MELTIRAQEIGSEPTEFKFRKALDHGMVDVKKV
jgi:hypothetical protein